MSELNGWITRDGQKFLCEYSEHDDLILKMGKNISEVEKAGWCRFTETDWFEDNGKISTWLCLKPLSAEQKNWLSRRGHDIDNDILR